MEWPSHASPADDTRCPWVLVPGSLEAEQKESEPSEHSGVGRAGEAETGAVWTRVPVKFYWRDFLQCSEQAVTGLHVFRTWKGIAVFTSSSKRRSSGARLQPVGQSLAGSTFAVWGSAEALTGITAVAVCAQWCSLCCTTEGLLPRA